MQASAHVAKMTWRVARRRAVVAGVVMVQDLVRALAERSRMVE
jgi:hypothetical protein